MAHLGKCEITARVARFRRQERCSLSPISMDPRKLLTAAGMAAGAALGATALYVAMRPHLRRKLRKTGVSAQSLALIGREMRHEAAAMGDEMRALLQEEAHQARHAARRLPRRWFRRGMQEVVSDGKAAAHA